ncbi:MAG TPA: DUF3667 domain-containing protein [Puia sp.]|nr:DUF3667 domain-containing protein [Puia sp.]
MKHCLNCGKPVHDLYCAHCGQQTRPERINFSFLSRETFHFFTHLDKGFLYTSFQMITHPGRTVKAFIDGKRKNYQSPISYFLFWTTVFVLFLLLIEKIFGVNRVIDYEGYFGPGSDTRLAISNLSIVLLVVIPFQSFYLYLLVTKKRYNYFETMVAILYALGTVILFQFLFAVFALFYHAVTSRPVTLQISDTFKIVYLIWFILDTIRLYQVNHKLIRAMSFITLAFGTFTLWRLYGLPASIEIFF